MAEPERSVALRKEGLEEGGQSSALNEAAWTMVELLSESLGFLGMLKPRRKVGR